VLIWGIVLVLTTAALVCGFWAIRYNIAVNRLARGIGQTMFYGTDGKPWFPLEEHRRDVAIARISPHLQRAVVAVEDHRFYSHLGIDPIGIGRALVRDVRDGGISEGGSTLTQQLARTLFLTGSRDLTRKAKEIVIALMMEHRLSKTRILELYLNRIYLGGNVYGVEAMCQNLFGKSAADVNLQESALVAGLIRAPSSLWPWSHYDRALRRSHVVLKRMQEEGLITAEDETLAKSGPPKILPQPGLNRGVAGYAQDYLRQQFHAEFGDDNPPGWRVQTTLSPALQREAERAVIEGLPKLRNNSLQTALVALDPRNGDVLALVGGRNFDDSPFNRAVNARRQPGSAFKPILYAAALESGMSPISIVSGLGDPRVDALTLREALYESNNQAAMKLQTQVGSHQVLRLANAVGLSGLPDVPSLSLGVGEVTPLQLTAAFAVFPNGGFAVAPRPIAQVLDSDGYAVLNRPVDRKAVISEASAFQMVSMLTDVLDVGTGAAARPLGVRFPAGGKTGTTDDFKDAWFVGFSSSIVVGVWVGLDQPAPIGPDGYGAKYALPIWSDFMAHAAALRTPQPFKVPSSVDAVRLCRVTHLLARNQCPSYTEYFKSGDSIPSDSCNQHMGPVDRAAQAVGGFFKRIFGGLFGTE
jgi:penicillin-binding protein 1A